MDLFIGGLTILAVLLMITGLTLLIGKFRKNKLKIKQKNWWLITHMIFVIIYLGGVFGMLLLAVLTKFTTDNNLVYASHVFIKRFDHFLVIPGAFGSLITGIWLAIRTHWGGLTKHYWVFAKWIGNIVAIILGSTYVRIWISDSLSASKIASGMHPLQNPAYLENRQLLFFGIAICLAILFFLVVISYIKPWGKRENAATTP
ncbi:DUF2269 family protein [Desulfocucumis palustris]|uniref:DUF2269 family protein n=1 Tax=Desulfocucumis palustris TaxID=1898651 RepID=UPI000CE9F534|nr:DUF2269 family protein [Desulfocucumis palustris]